MNAESRAKILNDDRPSIIDSKKSEPKNMSIAAKMITRTLNLHGKEQTEERLKLEKSKPKNSAMSWLDKLSSTTFVKGETISNDQKIQGSLQDASVFIKESSLTNFVGEENLVKPSFGDLEKQRRFEQYLEFSESEREFKLTYIQPLSMTEWERDQEVQEFEKAAKLCKNIDSIMDKSKKKEEEQVDVKVDLESLNSEDRMTAAAKMKMFGKLTRTDVEWKPTKLVCVRFNIAEPFVGVAEDNEKKKKFSIFDSMAWNEVSKFEKGKPLEYESEQRPSTSSGFSCADEATFDDKCITQESSKLESEKLPEREQDFEQQYNKVFGKNEGNDKCPEVIVTETDSKEIKKPETSSSFEEKKDLFKSIFLSSSEESESESETEETKIVDDEKLKAALLGKSASELNTQQNTSPPRGIFAKLDLDNLWKQPEKTETPKEKSDPCKDKLDEIEKADAEVEKPSATANIEEEIPPDVYGPALPEKLPQHVEHIHSVSKKNTELDDGKWIEKSKDKKKSKKDKKKHKHKERSRSKSKKKSKKEKRH